MIGEITGGNVYWKQPDAVVSLARWKGWSDMEWMLR